MMSKTKRLQSEEGKGSKEKVPRGTARRKRRRSLQRLWDQENRHGKQSDV